MNLQARMNLKDYCYNRQVSVLVSFVCVVDILFVVVNAPEG